MLGVLIGTVCLTMVFAVGGMGGVGGVEGWGSDMHSLCLGLFLILMLPFYFYGGE